MRLKNLIHSAITGLLLVNGPLCGEEIVRKVNNCLNNSTHPFVLAPCEMVRPQLCDNIVSLPINCHWVTSFADNDLSFEIEDGSHWSISPSDVPILRTWKRGDSIVITPNVGWFRNSYDYSITHRRDKTSVNADLFITPLAFGSYSHWIVDIDYYGGHVYLENHMVWCVDPQDSYKMKAWAINDHIVLGLYHSWFSSYDHILINASLEAEYIRVKQY